MAKKTKSVVNSITQPGAKVNIPTYLVELVMVRANKGKNLPPKFWNDLKWRGRFRREIMGVNKAIREYGLYCVIRAVVNNFIDTFTDYQKFIFVVQQELERLKRLAAAKDTSSIRSECQEVGEDLRDYKTTKKKGLFERLGELNG